MSIEAAALRPKSPLPRARKGAAGAASHRTVGEPTRRAASRAVGTALTAAAVLCTAAGLRSAYALTGTSPAGAPKPGPRTAAGDAAPGEPQEYAYGAEWDRLLEAGKTEEARKLCQGWTGAKSARARVEAEKCLAMLDLKESEGAMRIGTSTGARIGKAYNGPKVDTALEHISRALALAPQDLSIHRARLQALLQASRYDQMLIALDDSLSTYKGPEGYSAWLAFPTSLIDVDELDAAGALLKRLNAAFPGTREINANLGVVLLMLQRGSDALPYLKKAYEMGPQDPLDNWNLARYHDLFGVPEEAEPLYQKALSLQKDPATLKDWWCVYAGYLEAKRHEMDRACELQKQYCSQEYVTACDSGGMSRP